MIIVYKCGYTLVELIIVLAIIALLAIFGIPAISKYNRMSEFRQKSEEVKGLFNQVHALALNPTDTSVVSYRIMFDTNTIDRNTYSLVSCTLTDCNTVIEKVDLLSDRTIGFTAPGGSSWLIGCTTKLSDSMVSCDNNNTIVAGLPTSTSSNLIDDTTPIFSDNNPNVMQSIKFTIPKNTFNINLGS